MLVDASLAREAESRYLNYALSVIQSRALPDVRDGLKPVQRRILYTMHEELSLRSDGRFVKSARIVGEVMGKFHPHGDSSIYEAMVRMAQPFSLRAPLVSGQGNFGSPDGDSAAAMRYTEAKLAKLAHEMMDELSKSTVPMRPNYDGERDEPAVLPARFPNLLVNGAQGIAVGMATSIPPHNLGEVIDATLAVIDDPEISNKGLLKFIKGPDFPTGGQLISSKSELEEVYSTGQGSLKLRGTWKLEEPAKGNPLIVITSLPYAVERHTVVEKIAEAILTKKLQVLLDVRDESSDETRIVCELKKGSDPNMVMAYLYKNTPVQNNVAVNLTCLLPTSNADDAAVAPERVDLKRMLRAFIDFRMQVVTKRLQFDLDQVQKRIHVLEGFATVFDALDETIRIIRRSEGKRDAAEKLMKRFGLSEIQVDAILELRLYRLAQLEINLIRVELEEKQREAKRLGQLLASEGARFKLIKAEMMELRTAYADKRATKISSDAGDTEYDADAFIVEEDAFVLLTQQGWVKRQREVKDISTARLRDGDALLDVVAGSTKSCVAFLSSTGSCYVMRIHDVQASTGYGNPVQTLFKLADGEKIIRMLSFDPRLLEVPEEGAEPLKPFALAVTRQGLTARFSLRAHRDVSTRAGRKYMRLNDGDEVVYVDVSDGREKLACATTDGGSLLTTADEVPILAGAGKGVKLIKLDDGELLLGAKLLRTRSDELIVEQDNGKTHAVSAARAVVARGGSGVALFKRGKAVRVLLDAPTIPSLNPN